MKTQDEVSAIWDAMKADGPKNCADLDLCMSSLTLKQEAKKKPTKKKKAKKKNKPSLLSSLKKEVGTCDATLSDNQVLDKARYAVASSNAEEAPSDGTSCKLSTSILSWALENDSKTSTALGDSDDESEIPQGNENRSSPERNSRAWSIDRFVSALQAQVVQTRCDALRSLKSVIQMLHSQLPEVPRLDFPPPYDASRIVLTHKNGGVVSDMASGEFAPHWEQWQRTQSSLSDQFQTASESLSGPGKHGVASEQPATRGHLQAILNGCGHALFRRFGDKSEQCRTLALDCTRMLCLGCLDMGKHLAYLIPAIMARYPPAYFDSVLEVFVHDIENHDRYKRGGATERQDREATISRTVRSQIVEPSEENRLLLCCVIDSLLQGSVARGAVSTLNPYFSDMILALQSSLRDPFPAVKVESCRLLVQILRVPQWEAGAKHFATGIARSVISNLRHRNTKVRLASLDLFEASVSVPDRAKIKGAGTAAIADLVGFREENVLPIAAFYDARCGISVNALAEVVSDKNPTVRARCCAMLSFFMVCLPDRYDHQQRLLPYLLSFFHDSVRNTQQMAIAAVDNCGAQYEAENADDVIERRQYGIDGDSRCNHVSPLPKPFEARPRLGARLFVRANTKRFVKALLSELTNWVSATRKRSADLLAVLVVYCEEHLTMDFHQMLPSLVQSVQLARGDPDRRTATESVQQLLYVLELTGRYVRPETYVPLFLPRITGDENSATSFADGASHSEASRSAYAASFTAMLRGSLVKGILPHVKTIGLALSSDECLGQYVGSNTRKECMLCLVVLLEQVLKPQAKRDLKIYFQLSDRISDLSQVLSSCSKYFSAISKLNEDEELVSLAERGQKTIEVVEQVVVASL